MITQSLVELWKLIYIQFHNINSIKIPGYCEYSRVYVSTINDDNSIPNWYLVDPLDYEYFRIVEYFSSVLPDESSAYDIDLSFYDVNQGVYWKDLNISDVLSKSRQVS